MNKLSGIIHVDLLHFLVEFLGFRYLLNHRARLGRIGIIVILLLSLFLILHFLQHIFGVLLLFLLIFGFLLSVRILNAHIRFNVLSVSKYR